MTGSDLGGALAPLAYAFWTMAALCIVFVPLGI